MILNALMPVSAPLWFTEAGQLDAAELSDYLEQTKRIYDACMEGLPEELLQVYQGRAENTVSSSDEFSAYNDLQGGGVQIVAGNEKGGSGRIKKRIQLRLFTVCEAVGQRGEWHKLSDGADAGKREGFLPPLCADGRERSIRPDGACRRGFCGKRFPRICSV